MRSSLRVCLCLAGGVMMSAVLAGAAISRAEESAGEKSAGNGKCYVCHPAMKTEELTASHLDMGITCDVCHGASTEHMHDEMLMTKPDLLFGRSQVRKMCSNPACHKPGAEREVYGLQDHTNAGAVEAFIEKWTGRMRPNGRNVTEESVCTDCHGTHNITKPLKTADDENQAQWTPLFNGRDLKGWKSEDDSCWTVKSGRLVGAFAASTERSSSLWTEQVYEDYLLAVTFRAEWPIHAGIWSRGENSPRIEIFESEPAAPKGSGRAFTGSVLMPGKGLALINQRQDIEDRQSWNTISIKVKGDRIQVWLNGEEIGVVRSVGPASGKIGLYIKGQPDSRSPELSVREMLIQPLAKSEQ